MGSKVGLLLVLGMGLPLAFAASASAQSGALVITPGTASPGQQVTVTGSSFSSAAGLNPPAVRLSTRNGPVLANPTVDGASNITATFPAPATPGTYLILGTQTYANGRQKSFTPARGSLRVVAARRSESSAAMIAVPLGGLVLLGAGFLLMARRRSTLNRLQLGSR